VTRLAQVGILLLAAALRLWRLDQNDYDNEYYAAAVRSMTSGWHAFFYNAFDPAGFLSVDKPPLGLWVQVLSARLFGFSGASILLPQVVEGVASVWLVSHLVTHGFGAPAGLLAGFFLALTPVSVAVDRSNNVDACLVLALVLAAWALMRAVESGRRGLLLLAFALVGLGFNVKMLAAFVVLPTFALVYALGAPLGARRRVGDLTLAAAVLVAVAVPWMLIYDITPPERRPFAGSSRQNSMMELAVGHNALGRFVRAPRPGSALASPRPLSTQATEARAVAADGGASRARSPWAGLFVLAPVGPLRLADGPLAAQVLWLLPLAAAGLLLGARGTRWRPRLHPMRQALLLWAGWALTYAVVYSYAGGIFHFYYLATMAPPLAALAGIGVVALWRRHREGGWRAALLPAALLLTAAWQAHVEADALGWTAAAFRDSLVAALHPSAEQAVAWPGVIHLTLVAGAVLAAAALLAGTRRGGPGRAARGVADGALALGLVVLLVVPTAWALSSVLIKGLAVIPSADVARLLPREGISSVWSRGRSGMETHKLVAFLAANRQGERFLLGTSSTFLASPIIIETGQPVMAMGGFHGLDAIVSPEALARMVEARQVRFVMLGDLTFISRRMGAEAAGRPIADWVRAHGKPVDAALWRVGAGDEGAPVTAAAYARSRRMQLYDLHPEAGLVAGPS
jgi:4-amino-4-deoxy-L-arabinose transferase-like glycosyltransferase